MTASTSYGVNADEDVTGAGVTLNTNWLMRAQAGGGTGVILVEGTAATHQPLNLEIWKNGQKLGGVPLYLSLSGVEQMFRHKNLRDGADAPGGLVGDTSVRDNDPSQPTRMSEPTNNPDAQSNGKWFVFVVGSNVGGQNTRGWESEVFKRMYWSGNQAKFVGVSWYGDSYTNSEGVYDYHMAVRNAFATAPVLASFVNGLGGGTTVAGHSLGCGLIASAIADQGMNVNNACLMDAAFAQECFDGDADDDLTAMRPSAWQDYDPGLWAAHWHERFDSGDARSTLTWRNRFAGAADKVYNFYSSTEDCLGEYDGDVPSTTLGAVIASGGHFQSYVWVYQEKAKGNRQDYSPVLGLDILFHFHVGSQYGGWGFNLTDPLCPECGDPTWYKLVTNGTPAQPIYARWSLTPDEIDAKIAADPNLLPKTRWTPLFNPGWGREPNDVRTVYVDTSAHSGPDWIFNLYARDASGSAVAADPAKNAQLLAEAIPALSKPVGANPCGNILSSRQFDMAAQFADEDHWPTVRGANNHVPKWWHSDMGQVAYPYVFKLYKQLVSISNQ